MKNLYKKTIIYFLLSYKISYAQNTNKTFTPVVKEAVKEEFSLELSSQDDSFINKNYHFSTFDINPFVPLDPSEYLHEDTNESQNLLTTYDLWQLNYVGYWKIENDDIKAMITTPNGQAFNVMIGDEIGSAKGIITEILSDKIIIQEARTDPNGLKTYYNEYFFLNSENQKEKIRSNLDDSMKKSKKSHPKDSKRLLDKVSEIKFQKNSSKI